MHLEFSSNINHHIRKIFSTILKDYLSVRQLYYCIRHLRTEEIFALRMVKYGFSHMTP